MGGIFSLQFFFSSSKVAQINELTNFLSMTFHDSARPPHFITVVDDDDRLHNAATNLNFLSNLYETRLSAHKRRRDCTLIRCTMRDLSHLYDHIEEALGKRCLL